MGAHYQDGCYCASGQDACLSGSFLPFAIARLLASTKVRPEGWTLTQSFKRAGRSESAVRSLPPHSESIASDKYCVLTAFFKEE